MNFLGCANCQQRDFVLISNKTLVDEDEEEIVTYLRESLLGLFFFFLLTFPSFYLFHVLFFSPSPLTGHKIVTAYLAK